VSTRILPASAESITIRNTTVVTFTVAAAGEWITIGFTAAVKDVVEGGRRVNYGRALEILVAEMTGREGAAILAFFGVEPKKVACLTGSSIADAHRQGFSDRTQVEPQVELREIALPTERRARRLHADFFWVEPKKVPLF
jgi:hypothetical protein